VKGLISGDSMDYKVFKVDTGETEWWVANSKEQALDGMDQLYGVDEEDAKDLVFEELSHEEISKLKIRDLSKNGEPLTPALKMILNEFARNKDPLPFQLACTGY
jgi:hypothetical protein